MRARRPRGCGDLAHTALALGQDPGQLGALEDCLQPGQMARAAHDASDLEEAEAEAHPGPEAG
ncbi:MAG: hypothetical protein MJE77_20760, partial [Proteobacteria bacterium]|nr:hypothetical protein [Pseudomonadota bacterium]